MIEIFDLNVPAAFAPAERVDYEQFLDKLPILYFVYETDKGEIVAGAGLGIDTSTKSAVIAWDLIHPDHQRVGIGGAMARHRLQKAQSAGMQQLEVRTSQMAYGFYERVGLTLNHVTKDYWAPGYDLYQMSMLLEKQ